MPRGQSATSGRTVRQTPSHEKPLAKQIETKALKNTRRTRRTPGPKGSTQTVRTHHADSPRGFEQTREQQPESQLESTLPPSLPWISQMVKALEERFEEDVKRP
jgi:hypothetical protein